MTTILSENQTHAEIKPSFYEAPSTSGIESLLLNSKSEIPALTSEVMAGIDDLDELGSMTSDILRAYEITSTISVFAGIKPASLIVDRYIGDDSEQEKYKEIVSKLGLSMQRMSGKNYWIISRHNEIVHELSNTLEKYYKGNDGDETTEYQIGKLLGYPQSATEYFIKRWQAMDTAEELPVVDKKLLGEDEPFVQMVLSPDHYEAELESYVRPLKRTVQTLAPKSYEVIMNDHKASHRTSLGSKVLKGLSLKKS